MIGLSCSRRFKSFSRENSQQKDIEYRGMERKKRDETLAIKKKQKVQYATHTR
jgi:hypothetical protein